ncbi:laforin isoform X3 [Phyllopteryx taeniolatus]|uniref:laforin isoform X3 n=1 Tax=Phyllopteryx taeniolatus TaxID=161469 RepID=UPI002AD3FFEB|nr:laforin isoform X3 [Phyllopteryx taeniolatus]
MNASSMLFRFGVIVTPDSPHVELFVLGSREEMGQWEPSKAVRMTACRSSVSTREPCLWLGDVRLREPFKDTLWFKFIRRTDGHLIWEGNGPHHDRTCSYDEQNVLDGVHCHPIAHWIEETGHTDEMKHTTDFYFSVAGQNAMHFSRSHPDASAGCIPASRSLGERSHRVRPLQRRRGPLDGRRVRPAHVRAGLEPKEGAVRGDGQAARCVH